MTRVLVTGVGSLIGQGILRCLRSSSVKCTVFGTDYFPQAIGLYWVDKGFILPDFLKPDVPKEQWLQAVLDIIRQCEIDIVLVGLDFEVEAFAQHRSLIERETKARVVVADPKSVEICKDKYKTANFLKTHGLPYPDSCLLEDVDDFLLKHQFPLIVKPRFGFRSRDLHIVNDRAQLQGALRRCPMPVIQRLVGTVDQEYTCGSLCVDGKILSVIALRRYLKDGNTIRAVFDDECRMAHDFIQQVAAQLGAEGPLNFQLRLTPEGPIIFEINPRFSGTTYMRSLFGVNEVELLLNALVLKRPSASLQYRPGVVLRYFDDQFVPLAQYQQWERP